MVTIMNLMSRGSLAVPDQVNNCELFKDNSVDLPRNLFIDFAQAVSRFYL